jgi:hypothetical protein
MRAQSGEEKLLTGLPARGIFQITATDSPDSWAVADGWDRVPVS